MSDTLLSRLTLRQLRVLVAVVKHGTIQRAAQELGVTQPTATKSVHEVERLLGLKLFDRTHRGVRPTEYCRILVERARLAFIQLRHADQEIRELQEGASGHVAVGALLAASAKLLPEALMRFKDARPGVSVTLVEGTNDLLMPALRGGELDFVAGRLPEYRQRHGIVQEPLYTEIACLVVRPTHPLASRRRLALRELLDWQWILPRRETTLRRQIDTWFFDSELDPPQQAVESLSLLTNFRLTTSADFISIWPYQVVRDHLREKRLSMLPVLCEPTIGFVGISRRAGEERLSPAAEALLGHIREAAAAIRAQEAEWRSIFKT